MYATCLHCNAALGSNTVVEHFPVGRRLAFDAAKGRLWVICPSCQRWNLTPLEERWEAIDDCERLFRTTRLRTSTDNISLARAADGLDLVRIGTPLRREIAAWRYGSALQRRWKARWRLFAAEHSAHVNFVTAAGTIFYVATGAALISIATSGMSTALSVAMNRSLERDIRARVVLPDGQVSDMRSLQTSGLMMELEGATDDSWTLRWSRGRGTYRSGETNSARTLRGVLAYRNAAGGNSDVVNNAVERLVASPDARAFITRTARAAKKTGLVDIASYPTEALLALEMALHDEAERSALDGELAALANEWALAEEIAGIADDMFLTDAVRARFEALRLRDRGLSE